MEKVVCDAGLNKMGAISVQKIAAHTLERWAENFEKVVKGLLGS